MFECQDSESRCLNKVGRQRMQDRRQNIAESPDQMAHHSFRANADRPTAGKYGLLLLRLLRSFQAKPMGMGGRLRIPRGLLMPN